MSFGGVDGEVEEQGLRVLDRLRVKVGALRDEVDLPVAEARGKEFLAAVIAEETSVDGAFLEEERRKVGAVHRTVIRYFGSSEFRRGREEVQHRADVVGHTRLDLAGPPGDAGHAHATFPRAAFAVLEQSGAATGLGAHQCPRAVVAREEDEGIVGHAVGFERLEYLADVPVELGEHVAVDSARALALEAFRREERRVRESVRHIQEERLVLVRADELRGLFGVTLRQLRLVGAGFEELAATVEGGVPPFRILGDERIGARWLRLIGRVHVVRMHQSKVKIEAVGERVVLRLVIGPDAEVPLTDDARRVASVLECLRQRDLRGGQAAGRNSTQDAELVVGHAGADRVTTRQEGGATRGADLGGGIELGEAQAFGRHLVEMRGLNRWVTVAT